MTFSVESDEEARLDLFLARRTSRTRTFVKEQITAGAVKVNGSTITRPAQLLHAGDRVDIEFQEAPPLDLKPLEGNLEILYEDDEFLALNKAQGTVVHPAPGHKGPTLVHYLLHHLESAPGFSSLSPARPGIVHRLDRGTSGVLLIAKNRTALENLARQFKDRTIKKEYVAVAWGRMKESGRFQSTVGRDPRHRHRMSSKSPTGRDALTLYRRERAFDHFTYVRLFPHTGRTHQLRVHLSEAGHTIVGDDLYGKPTKSRIAALTPALAAHLMGVTQTFLHAERLTLAHPKSGETLDIRAPVPENFSSLLPLLEKEDPFVAR